MQEPPNVATNLLIVHQVITRAIDVAIDGCVVFAETGFPDASVREGFGNYVRTLVTVLRAHHLTEDELAFPLMLERVPSAPYGIMDDEHQVIDPLLVEVSTAIGVVENNNDSTYRPLKDLQGFLLRLRDVWLPHIRKEEENFSPQVLARLFSTEEHLQLIGVLSEHSRKVAQPDYLVVPFLLFNLPPDERARFSRSLPSVVTQELVPVAWKDRWASMRPFLLMSEPSGD